MSSSDDATPTSPEAQVTVGPVQDDGAGEPTRRVDVDGVPAGNAYSAGDVAEFMRRAGLGAASLGDPSVVEWRSGGPDVWE
jgi:hypothetical protein